jgi:phosphatidylethanolamine/phosphatidyl-N-methylethanolamine N-methyltransferase
MRKRLRALAHSRGLLPQWTFFRQWLKSPLKMAAISPSGRQLARQMLAELPANCQRVVELGGGTGVFTMALLNHGIAAEDLLVLELNETLHQHLLQRFPRVRVVCADAVNLLKAAERSGFRAGGPVDAVISGLGLLSMSKTSQKAILKAAFELLAPGGRFIQFTYGPGSPVAREVLEQLGVHARRGNLAWWNVPPATVYVFTRTRSRSIAATSMRG